MARSDISEVARELLERTRVQKVSWVEGGWIHSCRVFFPDLVISITRIGDHEVQEPEFQLQLTGKRGRVIDELASGPEDTTHQVLSEIFDLAVQYIHDSGIDKALEYLKGT